MTLTVAPSSVLTLGSWLLLGLLLGSFLSSRLLLLLLLPVLPGLTLSSLGPLASGSSSLASSDVSLDDFVGLDLKIAVDLGSEVLTESLLEHLLGLSIDDNLDKGTNTLSVLISDSLGTQSKLFSLSSSCTFREIPLTGPLWIRLTKWVA